MEYRPLGHTGLNVSTVAMGCWAIAGGAIWGDQDEGDAVAAIGEALDLGINLFDTAEGYGNGDSEALLAKGLGSRRDEAIIATKVSGGHLAPDEIVKACERSLAALGTDRIDIYQIHWPSRDVPLADSIAALLRLKDEGKIRHIGVSNFGPRDLADLAANGVACSSNQVMYNLITRAIEFDVVPRCLDACIGILAYSPLAQGILNGKFRTADDVPAGRARSRHFAGSRPEARHGEAGSEAETFAAVDAIRAVCDEAGISMGEAALAWCLAQPGITSVLAGARNPEQIRENARAAERRLPGTVLERLSTVTDPLKQGLGPSIDLWQSVANSRAR